MLERKRSEKKFRVVFMGTPEFAVASLSSISAHHDVVAVYTQPDRPVGRGLKLAPPPVKVRALELGLPVFQPERLSPLEEVERLRAFNADFFVVVAYGQILRQEVLDLPKLAPVNIHASLLPRWRGAAPIQWSILAGDAETGITTMRMVRALDAGEMYLRAAVPIGPEDTAQTLHDRLSKLGSEIILPTLVGIADGSLQGTPQDEKSVTLAPKLTREMEALDWKEDATTLDRRVRALNPWPGTSVFLMSGERLKIRRARPSKLRFGQPGALVESEGALYLTCKQGCLEVLEGQWDGKAPVDAAGLRAGIKGRGQNFPIQLK